MDRVQKPIEETDELCPVCGKHLVIRTGRFGRFIACSGYPECSFKKPFVVKTGALCPLCGGDLVERKSRKSAKIFYGCANWPTCSFVVWDRPLPLPCPECGGLLTLGNGRTEAVCYQCGAVVRDALGSEPEVVGHRRPGKEAAKSRPGRRSAQNAKEVDGAGAARGRAQAARTMARPATKKTAVAGRRRSSAAPARKSRERTNAAS
jgi:DNA topoisomerase-1